MLVLRSALYLAFLIAVVIPWAFVVMSGWLFPVHTRYMLCARYTKMAIWGARVICGIEWKIEGWDRLPDGPAILLPKHQSSWETLWLPSVMPRDLTFVYKRELNWLPFFGWGLASAQMISIDRRKGQDAFEQVVEQGIERLGRGWWIVIFPEGTRTAPGSTRRYKTGGARLAVRTGAAAVPIAVNSGELWPRKAFIKRPGVITVSIGPPIDSHGKSAEEVGAAVEAWIETEMRRLAPHRYSGPICPQRGCSRPGGAECRMNRRRPAPEQLALLLDIPVAPQQREDVRPRQLRIEHEVFTFRLRRARRRSIGFQIDDRGLTVSAPRWVPLREIEAAIVEKRRWIVTKQREWHEWCSRRRLPVLRFVDGDRLPYLGSHLVLRTDTDAVATHRQRAGTAARIAAWRRRAAGPRRGAGVVAGRGAPRLCRTDRALRRSHQQPLFRLESFIGAFAMGIVHARRAPAAQLAVDPLLAADRRLRGRP